MNWFLTQPFSFRVFIRCSLIYCFGGLGLQALNQAFQEAHAPSQSKASYFNAFPKEFPNSLYHCLEMLRKHSANLVWTIDLSKMKSVCWKWSVIDLPHCSFHVPMHHQLLLRSTALTISLSNHVRLHHLTVCLNSQLRVWRDSCWRERSSLVPQVVMLL